MLKFILQALQAVALLALLFVSSVAQAQTRISVTNYDGGEKRAAVRYRYLFENERFTTPLQEVEFDSEGHGQFRFKRKNGEEIVNKLEVSAPVLSQVQSLFEEMNFLSSNEEYQHKKDFSHLGKMTVSHANNGKERTVSFNYTDNQSMTNLTQIFRNIATQETRIFEIETVRSTDPISTPAQLRYLENELRSKNIADPRRFIPILEEIKMDESVPLIARNHAQRLLKSIEKGK
jgi:hypothetical protein